MLHMGAQIIAKERRIPDRIASSAHAISLIDAMQRPSNSIEKLADIAERCAVARLLVGWQNESAVLHFGYTCLCLYGAQYYNISAIVGKIRARL